jgi:DNA-binding protein HU-beta
MNKSELVDAVAQGTGVSKTDVDSVISSMFSVIADHLSESDEKIQIPGFISIQRTTRAPRTGRNPRTGETIQIAATKGVKVSAGSKLKNAAKG